MNSLQVARQRIGDFYLDAVLLALAARLDRAFPGSGWEPDARAPWAAFLDTSPDRRRAATGRSRRVLTSVPADL
jgi:hypothetical protein